MKVVPLKHNLGLVGYWDVVAWDEFEQQKGRNVGAVLIDTMQNYLANKVSILCRPYCIKQISQSPNRLTLAYLFYT